MRSRSRRTPAGMPVTMTVSCGPCDSPALTKRKRDMRGDCSCSLFVLRCSLFVAAPSGTIAPLGAATNNEERTTNNVLPPVAAPLLHVRTQRGEGIGLEPDDALRGERAADAVRRVGELRDRRDVVDAAPARCEVGARTGGRPDEERHAEA